MNSAKELLRHQIVSHLMEARWIVDAAIRRESELRPDESLLLGSEYFRALNTFLKASLDATDETTFTEVERKWAALFDDVWYPALPSGGLRSTFSEFDRPETPELAELVVYREVLRIGLAMWSTHRAEAAGSRAHFVFYAEAFRALIGRSRDLDWALDAYEAAGSGAYETHWTRWFLQELPDEEAHMIPTRGELLRTALLICLHPAFGRVERLKPRAWYSLRGDEIADQLSALEDGWQRWAPFVGRIAHSDIESGLSESASVDSLELSRESWLSDVAELRQRIAIAADEWREAELAAVRGTALSPRRVEEVLGAALKEAGEHHVLLDVFRHNAEVHVLDEPPDGELLGWHVWAHREALVEPSNFVGMDMFGRDMARPLGKAEEQMLFSALPDSPAVVAVDGDRVRDAIKRAIRELVDVGFPPDLIIVPHEWRLYEPLGLSSVGALEVTNRHVPAQHRRDYVGVIDGVPVLPLLRADPAQIWVLSIGDALKCEEWGAGSAGISVRVTSFESDDEARLFVSKQQRPDSGGADAEQIQNLRDRVLFTIRLCYRIAPGSKAGAVRLVPLPEGWPANRASSEQEPLPETESPARDT